MKDRASCGRTRPRNTKGLTEVSPLHIKVVAGAGLSNYMQIDLEPFQLVV